MSRQTSIPLPSGNRASSRATSGRAAGTGPSASAAVPASPTTTMSRRDFEQVDEAAPDYFVVVEEEDGDGRQSGRDRPCQLRSFPSASASASMLSEPPRPSARCLRFREAAAPYRLLHPDPIVEKSGPSQPRSSALTSMLTWLACACLATLVSFSAHGFDLSVDRPVRNEGVYRAGETYG